MKRTQSVAAILRRYQRWRRCQVPVTWGDVCGDTITRLSGDDVALDTVERALIHLKRSRVISGRRMVALVARHLLEAKAEHR